MPVVDVSTGPEREKRFQAVQHRAIHQILFLSPSFSLDFHSSLRKPVAVAVAAICSTIAAVFSLLLIELGLDC